MDKIKILVVDDEARMRKLVRDFLNGRDSRSGKPETAWKPWRSSMRRKISPW